MLKNVISEADRCLKCRNARCKEACPVKTPVNEMMKMLTEGNILQAGEMLFNNNPLSVVCSLVCPHEIQCCGNCVLEKKEKGRGINVSAVEHYISEYYLNFQQGKQEKNKDKKVAIIGTGPAGITIAIILAQRGYDITMFEAHDKIGGVLRYGIPEFRLPKRILDELKDKLISMGVKIRPNTYIGTTITVDHLFRDGYKAIFIGTGVWKPKSLNIKGESLGNVHFAIEYLQNPDVYDLGEKLCIIGAGNVAMDVARTAIRKGMRDVTILYRRGEKDITAIRHEVEYAKLDGVRFEFYKTPIEIVDEGVIYKNIAVERNEFDEEFFIEQEDNELFSADSVIIAVSQGPKNNIVSTTNGISFHEKNGLLVTNEIGSTTRPGVFASGDVVTGAKTVVEAVRLSKIVADAIDEYVSALLES